MRKKAPVAKMTPNRPKIIEAIVLLVSEADKLQKTASQYDIVKAVFLADRRHINDFGRPITFDKYVAMKHGPVPSTVYDILKADPGQYDYPWERVPKERGVYTFRNAVRSVDENILSESDILALRESFVIVKSLGFHQIRKLTHEDAAYIDAWEDDGNIKAFDMSYAMMFDVPDVEKANDIAFFSENI